MGMAERRARRLGRHLRGGFAGRGDVALVNAGALHDPLVGCVDLAREIGVGKNSAWQITPAAEHDGAANRHKAAPPNA